MLIFDFHIIGKRLLALRKRKGLTQAEVAEKAYLSERAYADIERGKTNMRLETILSICKALEITPDEILTDQFENELDFTSLMGRLVSCSPKEQETAYQLLKVYLNSL